MPQVTGKNIWSWRVFKVLTVRDFCQPSLWFLSQYNSLKNWLHFWPACFQSVHPWARHCTKNIFPRANSQTCLVMFVRCIVFCFVFHPHCRSMSAVLETLRFGWEGHTFLSLLLSSNSMGLYCLKFFSVWSLTVCSPKVFLNLKSSSLWILSPLIYAYYA